jgi:signal transduction histidine kinase
VRLSLRARLIAGYLALVLVVGGVTVVVIDRSIGDAMVGELDARLVGQAREVARWLETRGRPDTLAPRLARVVAAQITIVGSDGTVVGDSANERAVGQPIGNAPEVADARNRKLGRAERQLRAGGPTMYMVAVPTEGGGAVRVAVPLSSVQARRRLLRNRMLIAAGVGLIAAVLLGLGAIRAVTRPLQAMTRTAERLARGDYDVPAPEAKQPRDELELLSRTLAQLAGELKVRISQLHAAEKVRREFLASAAHELRTPVTAISGYSETLLGGEVDEAASKEFLATIHRNAARISRLVDDLLELERLEARPERLAERVPVVLAPLIGHAAATARAAAAARELPEPAIAIDVAADLAVLGDGDGLDHVVQNLIDNAVSHGGGTIRVAARRDGGKVLLTVADDGPGIPAEHLPRIFERFYRADAGRSRARGGSGLGLAIVDQQVAAMGGTIAVDSAPGQGTTFTVTLDAA